jgi:Na+(H+)/acetate symporter ActP
MTLTTAVEKKATQQTDYFTSGRQVIGVSNTLFALAYFVPALTSLDCETCLEISAEKQIID